MWNPRLCGRGLTAATRACRPQVRLGSSKLRTVAEDLPDDGAAVGRDDGARGVDDLLG